MDRNRLEQDAMQHLNRGNPDAALQAYLSILKADPRDRRIRQKVGELFLRVGRPLEAERHFREVADALLKENAYRAAVAVLKQLVALRPEDPAVQMELGECYVASGYPNDARQHYDAAMRLWIGQGRALDAAKAARKLAEQSPGEPAARLKVAELLEGGGDPNGAAAVYQEVAEEYRRRGRPDEVGRVAEMALRLRPDDVGLLLDAAAARVEASDWKKALVHLQTAFTIGPREARTLDLLARAFEGVGQPEKALKVLVELAKVAVERRDVTMEADALRRAARLAPEDAAIRDRLMGTEERLSRLERRITALVLAEAASEEELRVQVRAEVYLRYGFADRAEGTLRTALEARPDALPLLAAYAEVLIAIGRTDDAVRVMERILPRAGAEADAVRDRIAVIGGTPRPEAPARGEGAIELPETRGDRLAALGDVQGAMLAYREALAADPTNEDVLARIASLRTAARNGSAPSPSVATPVSAPKPAPAPKPIEEDPDAAFADFGLEDGTFAEVSPEALDEVEPEPADGAVDEARALVAVGLFAEALALVGPLLSLEAAVLRAQATKGLGDTTGAVDILREAVNEAAEDDPAYCPALFELSGLYTATGKHRSASRLLEEVRDLDPSFRPEEVEARLRGLAKFLK